ncbi:MAG: DUF3868 domain-containing protein [Prevotellaceae bacterium]|nr:DUF3868 domain-containing protein [Prevotellaceae bacterium]
MKQSIHYMALVLPVETTSVQKSAQIKQPSQSAELSRGLLVALSAALLCGLSLIANAQTMADINNGETVQSRDVSIEGIQEVVTDVSVDSPSTEHYGDGLTVAMRLGLDNLKIRSNQAVLLTPRLVNGADSLDLPSVGIYGRRRYYYYIRQGESMLSGKDEESYRAKSMPAAIDYSRNVSWRAWMDGADLSLRREDFGCCNTLLAQEEGWLGRHLEAFSPELVYVRPEAQREKIFSLEGSAFIDFPVNQTVIYPDYHNNMVELGKIELTIDSIRNDKDVTITNVWLKGYASPEGSYRHNTDLAKGRTASLENHIKQMYDFPDSILSNAYEPEDWEGLRRYVESSTGLNHRAGILELIDSDMDPDVKEAKIKATYPDDYRFLLENCYPTLRHTDYRVSYTISSYSNVEEIRRLMRTSPQKLSLEEFYLVAQEYEPGTDEFTEVFEMAVRLFPDDETANLNAANAAMSSGDLTAAEHYLEKAGTSAEAAYAHAALAIYQQDFDTARGYLEVAKAQGLQQAAVTLDELDKGRR